MESRSQHMQSKCKGSALAMETEGVDLWICISLVPRRSRLGQSWTLLWAVTSLKETRPPFPRLRGDNGARELRDTEYYGEGDSQSFCRVEGVSVEKKECTGHAQKRVEFSTSYFEAWKPRPGKEGQAEWCKNGQASEILLDINLGKCGKWMEWKYAIHTSPIYCASSESPTIGQERLTKP